MYTKELVLSFSNLWWAVKWVRKRPHVKDPPNLFYPYLSMRFFRHCLKSDIWDFQGIIFSGSPIVQTDTIRMRLLSSRLVWNVRAMSCLERIEAWKSSCNWCFLQRDVLEILDLYSPSLVSVTYVGLQKGSHSDNNCIGLNDQSFVFLLHVIVLIMPSLSLSVRLCWSWKTENVFVVVQH